MMKYSIIGSGKYNWDIIKLREYPNEFRGWKHVKPQQVSNVVDWGGCGDTITAVFLNELAKLGLPKVVDLTEEQVRPALIAATKKAALCTQYYGSKGWLITL